MANSESRVYSRVDLIRFASSWQVLSVLITLLLLLPILTIGSFLLEPVSENWEHIKSTVLPDYVINSLILMGGVTIGAGVIGTSTAWLTSMYQFPGKNWFVWALLLPLAIPAYIIAYTYTGLLDVGGPVQQSIRSNFGLSYGEYWFPEVRSIGGAIMMFSLVLYPYVYLLARAAFINQSICVLEASRTLGCNHWQSFYQVALPLARPAIATGLSLVLMETLADYGTVEYFGVSTFTTGIFRAWFGMYDAVAAAQLSAILLLFVFALVMLEHGSRRRARFHHTTDRYQQLRAIELTKGKGWLAAGICLVPLALGFLIPVGQLLIWAIATFNTMVDSRFVELAFNSFGLASLAALVALIPALILAYGNRSYPSVAMRFCTRLSAMGYAVPGTVIAVGVLIPFGAMDNAINSWMKANFNISSGLILSGTIFVLIFAYTVRFLAVSLQTVGSWIRKNKTIN